MRAFHSDDFVLPLPQGHRFPMEKYRLLRERVADDPHVTLSVPEAATNEALARVHGASYIEAVETGRLSPQRIRQMGFPWSPGLVERSRRSVGGTVAAARAALEDGTAANLAGGTHHAFPDRGEGFCVFNDVAVAVRSLQAEGLVGRAVILDLDVHQGNGTAAIFARDDTAFTLSVHGARNYPFRKEASDLDVALEDGAGDDVFLSAVDAGVAEALERGADIVFYLAGADPYEKDRLGRLSVSKEGLKTRDRIVFETCRRRGLPVAVVMSGGYARRVEDTVDIHASTIRAAARTPEAAEVVVP